VGVKERGGGGNERRLELGKMKENVVRCKLNRA
jgi:hypothetical protein